MMYESGKNDGKRCICIYCMGEYGLETYFKLRENGIKIDFFADGNPQKKGYALDGIYCKSYEELLCESKEIVLIVAKESAVKKLAANTRPAIKKEPLTDIELVKRMKKSIQEALYHASDNIASDLPNKNMISDYLLRHSRGK